jgi:hypothetical protein
MTAPNDPADGIEIEVIDARQAVLAVIVKADGTTTFRSRGDNAWTAETLRRLAETCDPAHTKSVIDAFIAEREQYITALKTCAPDNNTDYWRWQGNAEARRQLAERLGR